MLNVTELRNGTVYKEGNNLLQVLTYEHVKMGRGSGNIKVKVKNLEFVFPFECVNTCPENFDKLICFF